jgi:predicted nucleotidyltransferase
MPATLHELLPRATIRVVTHFLVHPESELHFRALQRHTALGIHSLQREVARLESLGLIDRREEDGRVVFRAVADHPSWDAFRVLVREHAHPGDILREAIHDVEGIDAAFVFGSQVRGDTRPDSDVDLLVVGDEIASHQLGEAMLRAQALLDRRVDVKHYTRSKLAAGLAQGSRFLHEVLAGPKEWLVGSAEVLPTVASAPAR